jgi:hypothetical protein
VTTTAKEPTMSDRLLDQFELGARVAQSLIADNDLSPAARHAALCWRAAPVVVARAGTARPAPAAAAWRTAPRLAEVASGFCCAA